MRIILDGNQVGYLSGDECFTSSVKFDEDICLLYCEIETTIGLADDGYRDIRDRLIAGEVCSEIPIELRCEDELILEGTTDLIDSGLNLETCVADITIKPVDQSSLIVELKDRAISNKTRSSRCNTECCDSDDIQAPQGDFIRIIACDSVDNADFKLRRVYKLTDLFAHWINWATCGELSFCNNANEIDDIYVTTGLLLRTGNDSDFIQYSLTDLMAEIKALCPIRTIIENGCFTIYSYDGFNDNKIPLEGDFKVVGVSPSKSRIFSSIKIGGDYLNSGDSEPECPTPVELEHKLSINRFFTWREAEIINPNCSNGEELDLTNDWKIDHNSIQEVVQNLNESFDRDTFLLQGVNVPGNYPLMDTNVPQAQNNFYNTAFQNYNKLQKYTTFLSDSGFCWEAFLPESSVEQVIDNNFGFADIDDVGIIDQIYLNYFSMVGLGFDEHNQDAPVNNATFFGGTGINSVPVDLGDITTGTTTDLSGEIYDYYYTTFTPTETKCYCFSGNFNLSTQFDRNFSWGIWEESQNFFDAGEVPVVERTFNVSEFGGNQTGELIDFPVRLSLCAELQAGTTYIIDQIIALPPFPPLGVDDFEMTVAGNFIEIFDCDAQEGCESNSPLFYTVQGKICTSQWNEISKSPRGFFCFNDECFGEVGFSLEEGEWDYCTQITELKGISQ